MVVGTPDDMSVYILGSVRFNERRFSCYCNFFAGVQSVCGVSCTLYKSHVARTKEY